MTIFDPRKTPKADSPYQSRYGEEAMSALLANYGSEKLAETLHRNQLTQKPS